ncbi:MAG: hypothetical protein OHK0047_25280 [Leptolyngbyaceae cyanobacterium]
MNSDSSYSHPVDRLLTYKDCRKLKKWPNYPELFGFTAEHIPDLIRMATDPALNWADSDSLEVWAPIHAWRALGQLHTEAAIAPLLSVADELEESEWFGEELPEVFALIGAAAIQPCKDFLADNSHPFQSRITVAFCLEKIGNTHPELRSACVAALTEQLSHFQKNSPELNGFLVSYLLDLKAVESASTIEQAFAAKWVDDSIAGDWLDVQYALGLISRAELRERRFTVDAEHLAKKATNPIAAPPRGFGGTGKLSSKKSKKK